MPFVKTIRGKDGITLEITMPDSITDTERFDFLQNLQEIINQYDTKEEFVAALERVAAKLGHKVETEITH